jgi:hypothetical protein
MSITNDQYVRSSGIVYCGSGWFRGYIIVDSTAGSANINGNNMLPIIYPNYVEYNPANPLGVVLWGVYLEKSAYPIKEPGVYNSTTSVSSGGAYTKIVFPYNPSNIEEVENNVYSTILDINGTMLRSSKNKDTDVKSMRWDILHYTKYSTFYTKLKEVEYKTIGKDVILQYPSYIKLVAEPLKQRLCYIRVLGVSCTFLEYNNCASIEMKYIITGSVY